MADLPVFEMERVFDAPRRLVWKGWTDPKLVARWYGPNVETVIHKFDLRPGGVWLNEMKMKGFSSRERMEFTEVAEPERLVWLHSMADENWTVAANPMQPDWPRVLLTTVTFAEDGDRTTVRLTWAPHEATQAEIACFAESLSGLGMGWGAGMDLLAALLAESRAAGE